MKNDNFSHAKCSEKENSLFGKQPLSAIGLALAAIMLCASPQLAHAQSSFADRLASDRLAQIRPGAYQAGDDVQFIIEMLNSHYLMQITGKPEVFVLYPGNASLGGRVLKYDSGETALRVAGWGGITLYTDEKPGGLPAVRTADATTPTPQSVSLKGMEKAAKDEMQHLAYIHRLHISFTADWKTLANDADQRALAFDAMENAVRGIDRFANNAKGRAALAGKVKAVYIVAAAKPTLALKGDTIIVTFNPAKYYAGRASSRAIARALSKVFHVPIKHR